MNALRCNPRCPVPVLVWARACFKELKRAPGEQGGGGGFGRHSRVCLLLLYLLNTKIRYRRARFLGGRELKRRVYTVNILAGSLPDACSHVPGTRGGKRGCRPTGCAVSRRCRPDTGTVERLLPESAMATLSPALMPVPVPALSIISFWHRYQFYTTHTGTGNAFLNDKFSLFSLLIPRSCCRDRAEVLLK